ncbi:hypothetical protein ACFX1T_008379 [Malus domestica]
MEEIFRDDFDESSVGLRGAVITGQSRDIYECYDEVERRESGKVNPMIGNAVKFFRAFLGVGPTRRLGGKEPEAQPKPRMQKRAFPD